MAQVPGKGANLRRADEARCAGLLGASARADDSDPVASSDEDKAPGISDAGADKPGLGSSRGGRSGASRPDNRNPKVPRPPPRPHSATLVLFSAVIEGTWGGWGVLLWQKRPKRVDAPAAAAPPAGRHETDQEEEEEEGGDDEEDMQMVSDSSSRHD